MAAGFDQDKYINSGEWKIAVDPVSSHYEKLGLRFDDSLSNEQINEAFYKRYNWWIAKDKIARSGQAHPTIKIVGPFIPDAIKNLIEAKSILSDTAKKSQYDNNLREEINKRDEEQRKKMEKGLTREGDPKLEIVDENGKEKTSFEFKNMRLGNSASVTVTAKNGGGGTLDASIKTNRSWLIVDTNKVHQSKLPQRISITVDPKKDSRKNTFGGEDTGLIEITYKKGGQVVLKTIQIDFNIEMPEADLSRFMLGLTIGSLIFGGLFGYFIYNLNLIQGMNENVAGIAGIAALIGAVIAAGKLGYQDEGFGAALGFGCGTLVVLFIIIAILDSYFPHALSVFSWTLVYGSFANLLSTTIRRAFWRGNLAVPIVAGTMILALTVGIIYGGFVSAKQEREAEIARAKVVQRAILRARTKLPGEWHGKADKSRAKLVVFREGNKFSGKMVLYLAKSWVEQKLSVNFQNKNGQIGIILKGTSYKRLKGKGAYHLDTFYGTLSPDGRTLKGTHEDTRRNRGKWSVSKLSPRSVRLFVKTEPAGARIRVLNIGPKFYQGMELEAGRYHIEVSKTGCETESRWVELSAGEDIDVQIRLKPKAVSAAKPIYASSKDQLLGKLGLVVQDLTGELVEQFGYRESQGVLVAEVEQGSFAALVGIRQGYLIEKVNRKRVHNMDEFVKALAQSKQKKSVLFRIRDRKFSRYVVIPIK